MGLLQLIHTTFLEHLWFRYTCLFSILTTNQTRQNVTSSKRFNANDLWIANVLLFIGTVRGNTSHLSIHGPIINK